jgi:RimJ/RimL family protein N-acetyltransferase
MMAELGGPRPRAEVLEKVQRDVLSAKSGEAWILMVVPDGTEDVAGSVVVWTNRDHGEPFSEIGWMILPEYQGQGLAKASVGAVLERARREDRWGVIHAFPSVTNGPSNGVCRALDFVLVGEEPIEFAGEQFVSNHWRVDPGAV